MLEWYKDDCTVAFMEYLVLRRIDLVKQLIDSEDEKEMYRLQGEVRGIDKVFRLHEQLRSHKKEGGH